MAFGKVSRLLVCESFIRLFVIELKRQGGINVTEVSRMLVNSEKEKGEAK